MGRTARKTAVLLYLLPVTVFQRSVCGSKKSRFAPFLRCLRTAAVLAHAKFHPSTLRRETILTVHTLAPQLQSNTRTHLVQVLNQLWNPLMLGKALNNVRGLALRGKYKVEVRTYVRTYAALMEVDVQHTK